MKHREGKILVSIVIVMVIFMLLDITHSSYDEKIENSVAVYKNLAYFADNGGWLQCIDLNTLQPVWIKDVTDDTDSTIVIEEEPEGQVVLYTACEVDKQGSIGVSYIRKIDALSGQLIIFNLARCGGFNKGLLIALNKSSGDEVWSLELPSYSWSSPVDVYTENGDGYIILCDSAGRMYLIDGMNGTVLDCISLGANIEGSPAVFEDMVVVGTRGQKIFGIKIR
ncbi:MAG: PQQ-binding-like beta-propeller repeat protein [Lutispora sp.]